MVFHLQERFPSRAQVIKTTIQYGERSLPLSYVPQRIGKDPAYMQTFFQRADVADVFAKRIIDKPLRVEKKQITSRDGDTHDYLVVRQGKMRFLFDMPEDPTTAQQPSEMTWVVPYQTMITKGLLPKSEENNFHRFRNIFDVQRFLRIVEHEGYFAGRDSGAVVEHNTDFIQPVPALLVTNTAHARRCHDTKLLLPIRSTANLDTRLSGMIVAPFAMGHSDPEDLGNRRRLLNHAAYREIAEETAYTKDPKDPNQTFHVFKDTNGKPAITIPHILRLRQYYRFRAFGVVYVDDKEIDKVHAGYIILAEPKTKHVVFILNGKSHESLPPVWQSPAEYTDAIAQGKYNPASWNGPIITEGIVPYVLQRRRYSFK